MVAGNTRPITTQGSLAQPFPGAPPTSSAQTTTQSPRTQSGTQPHTWLIWKEGAVPRCACVSRSHPVPAWQTHYTPRHVVSLGQLLPSAGPRGQTVAGTPGPSWPISKLQFPKCVSRILTLTLGRPGAMVHSLLVTSVGIHPSQRFPGANCGHLPHLVTHQRS